jgi:DNA-binding MarR family transcriptional regulator
LAEQGTLKELADMAELDRSTLARNIKPLMKKNLVYDAKADGARNSKLALTQEGIKKLEHAKQLWNHAQQQVQEKLGQTNISELEKVLKTLETL